ncbi:MAG: hypothetical protein R3D98_07520 [Candidatus Krumholzibacteriia bacterium]
MASKKTTLILVGLGLIALLAGCGSDNDSNPVSPVDTAPPALPGNLDVQYAAGQSTAVVTWDQNVTDADFAGFLVSRGAYDNAPVALVSDPQSDNSFEDQLGSDCGRQVTYYVYSVDTSDNVSAAATITLVLPDPIVRNPQRIAD